MAIDILRRFGKRLRKLRKKRGMSQEELGFQADLHRTYIGSIERGRQNMSLRNIEKLAKTLKISLSEMFRSV